MPAGLGAIAVATLVIVVSGLQEIDWIILMCACLYAIFSAIRLLHIGRRAWKRLGGITAHLGVACLVLGVLFSSGYSEIVSLNQTGMVWHKDFPDEVNEENILLFQHEWRKMSGYQLRYRGVRKKLSQHNAYVPVDQLRTIPTHASLSDEANHANHTPNNTKGGGYATMVETLQQKGQTLVKRGDTVHIEAPNDLYFEIEYQHNDIIHRLYPRAKETEAEGVLYSPYILKKWGYDLYVHVRTYFDEEQMEWQAPDTVEVAYGEVFFVNDYVAQLVEVQPLQSTKTANGIDAEVEADWVMQARIAVQGQDQTYYAMPTYVIRDHQVGTIADVITDLSIEMRLLQIDPVRKRFTIRTRVGQKPWVIIEIVKKPLINLLWLGACLLFIGTGFAFFSKIRVNQSVESIN